jgi:hypothetical protein
MVSGGMSGDSIKERTQERKKIIVQGWVSGSDDELVQIFLEDISEGGASITSPEAMLPDTFKLYFSPRAQNFRICAVRWRKDDKVGVQFVRSNGGSPVNNEDEKVIL